MADVGIRAGSSITDETPELVTGEDLGGGRTGMHVASLGKVSSVNSTTTPLVALGVFTGEGEQNALPQVGVMVKTDKKGVMYFDFSSDGTNWDSTFPVNGFQVAADISEFHTAVKLGRYFRVRFQNLDANDPQTYLRLTTYYGEGFMPANQALNQSVGLDTDAIVTRPNSFADEVIIGRRSGIRNYTKFGYRLDLAASSGEQTIWATTGNFTPLTTASTFTIAFNSGTDGSGTTGANTLYFDYIDSDGLYANTTVTLDGSGSQVTSFSGFGINRVAVVETGSAQTNTNDITITATTGGTTQAFVPAGEGVTQQCIFHTDANSDAVARYLWCNINKTSGGGSPRVTIKAYVFNRTYSTKFEVFRATMDTSVDNFFQLSEPNGFALSPRDVLYFVADTDTNSTVANLRFSLMEYKRD